jgi:hypothetical protein
MHHIESDQFVSAFLKPGDDFSNERAMHAVGLSVSIKKDHIFLAGNDLLALIMMNVRSLDPDMITMFAVVVVVAVK